MIVSRWIAKGRRLVVPGAATWVWEEGEGEPVLCLHGVPASSFLYRKVLPELARRGLRGVALDFPGLGMAERPPHFDYRWSGLSRWLEGAIDRMGLDRFHLVVHDIAGPIGFDLIGRVPDRIQTLTVLNTIVKVASFQRPWVMEPFAWPGLGRLYLSLTSGPLFAVLMRMQGVATRVPREELAAYISLLKRGDNGAAFLKMMQSFERTRAFEDRIVAALSARTFPAQIAWGADDPALKIDQYAPHLQAILGVDHVHRLRGKHFVQEDSPAEIAELVAAQVRA